RGRGGIVENIYIENISMFDIATEPFLFDLYYMGKSAVESFEDGDQTTTPQAEVVAVDETTPIFRNIYVKNLVARNARRAMYFNGLPEMNITNINVENAFLSAQFGAELVESDGINFKNITLVVQKGPALDLYNVKNFEAEGLEYSNSSEEPIVIQGENSQNININK
ncbi:glycoside hydrolase family 28 protein, partial [Bacteroidales bacterium OttesenSCG-928-A17]|nr:glycoside hydrolase family 28 protein [Bacteroidales bacterium OttesenSCG-928-A17]